MDEFRRLLETKTVDKSQRVPLHKELLYNQAGQLNDGPACEQPLKLCAPKDNENNSLYFYQVRIQPLTNYTSDSPTKIEYEGEIYKFEGFAILSHEPLPNLLPCSMTRFNIEYKIELEEDKLPTNFTIEQLELLKTYLFSHLLELHDLDWRAHGDKEGCQQFHLYPKFTRVLPDGTRDLLPIERILSYIVRETNSLLDEAMTYGEDWLSYRRRYKDMIVWAPEYRPSALRIDQIDFEDKTPIIVHFSSRPPQLSYSADPSYQRASKELLKFRHLLANKPKVTYKEKRALAQKEETLRDYRAKVEVKNDTIILPCERFLTTGLHGDVIQHSILMPVIVYQVRFQSSLQSLEKILKYQFKDKYLLQLALTHPSYRENYGTNPDHARNSLNNLGYRQLYYGDNRSNYETRKRGINTLFAIMSRLGCQEETVSRISHNERLEFLGDAVVEFLTSIHLYFIFPDLEEGGLATYRAALVQNQHLALLAKKLQLEKFLLYAHGSDLCHDIELRHAMANCFEALMAALFLDGGLEVADKVLANVLFDEPDLLKKWINYPKHLLQQQNPEGDRDMIEQVPLLKKMVEFEGATGIKFKNIRLLARAFTHRSVGFNNLTLGTNQRMEFLGDTVLQLIASEYLYKHFPRHHEGHLSLLRSSLVNNRTQMVVCDDLGMADYLYHRIKGPLRAKDRADLLEAFIGALYVDGGLEKCRAFSAVCFFPRLKDFIIHQSWNDPKSKLQQCCLTLRSLESREPDIPIYKVIDTIGPTNTRVYKVAVYFKDVRLATGQGPSIQEAEMAAATNALEQYRDQFPQLGSGRKTISSMRHESVSSSSIPKETRSPPEPLQSQPPQAQYSSQYQAPYSHSRPYSRAPRSPPRPIYSPPPAPHPHYPPMHHMPSGGGYYERSYHYQPRYWNQWDPVPPNRLAPAPPLPPYHPRYEQPMHHEYEDYYMMPPPPPGHKRPKYE